MSDNSRETNTTETEGNGAGARTPAFLTLELVFFPAFTLPIRQSLSKRLPLVIDRNMSLFVPVITDSLYTSPKENSIS